MTQRRPRMRNEGVGLMVVGERLLTAMIYGRSQAWSKRLAWFPASRHAEALYDCVDNPDRCVCLQQQFAVKRGSNCHSWHKKL